MKILVVCGHGLGTSLMMEMSIKSILKELAVTAEVDDRDLAFNCRSAAAGRKRSVQMSATAGVDFRPKASTVSAMVAPSRSSVAAPQP